MPQLGPNHLYSTAGVFSADDILNAAGINRQKFTFYAVDLFFTMFFPNCDQCEKPAAHMKCGQCKCMYYCDRNCQKLHWKEHKSICKALTAGHKDQKSHVAKTQEAIKKNDTSNGNSRDLECSICLEVMDSPVILPCDHKFCFACLNTHNGSMELDVNCPLCRSELPNNLFQFVYCNAVMFLRRANSEPFGSDKRLMHALMAQLELRKLPPAVLETQPEIRFCLGDVHLCLGEFQEALDVYRPLVTRIKEPKTLLGLHINLSKAYIGLGDFETSKLSLRDAMHYCDQTDAVPSRQIFSNFSRCCYELGEFADAIEYGEIVIEMNRHYEGAYTYVALAHKAQGNFSEAVHTMQRACAYETPWDPVNIAKVNTLLIQCMKEKDEAVDGTAGVAVTVDVKDV